MIDMVGDKESEQTISQTPWSGEPLGLSITEYAQGETNITVLTQ